MLGLCRLTLVQPLIGSTIQLIIIIGIIRDSNSGARWYHERDSGTVNRVSSGQTLMQVSSGVPPIIDQCSSSETLEAAVADEPPHITYYSSLEASR